MVANGTASADMEIGYNVGDSSLKNGLFSYNFSQIYAHDNKFSNVGHISIDTSELVVNKPILVRLDKSVNSVTYSGTVAADNVKVDPGGDWYFIKFPSGADALPTWRAFWKGTTTTGQSARQAFIAHFTDAVGSFTTDHYLGFGGSGAITNAAVTLPTDGRLPYVMTSHFLNAFDDNITMYGATRGKTSIIIQRDTIVNATDATTFFAVASTHNTYDSTKTFFCSNIFNGSAVTSGMIYKDPLATTFGYLTDCSVATWNGSSLGGAAPIERYIFHIRGRLRFKARQ
jgi:hypothetical protein